MIDALKLSLQAIIVCFIAVLIAWIIITTLLILGNYYTEIMTFMFYNLVNCY